ncbi:MAG: SprT family zinc-dependent metalloprotease [bacterium]
MLKIFKLGGWEVEVMIRRVTRTRFLRLNIRDDGVVTLSVPKRLNLAQAERFLIEKSEVILGALLKVRSLGRKTREEKIAEYKLLKKQALAIVENRVGYFAPRLGVSYRNISIRNQRTRWGSCSRRGNLNFNYKIALLRAPLADYLVVHELCHLKEFSHSKKFWGLVQAILPDYLALRREMRHFGKLS